ncbi:lipoprotein [Spiroplasma alleghenense]|uniref:Lipoprotein n=1 Tax=Spiroplasma alleghenense TaxID=216931 RepID=A0A345Z292_9MOLU|nr:lipoprotein [Spiroplasma alleghenense]AXK50721.1 hypothetical protein SALLE_v1c00450 [Spiroplasma alleghenense]
MKKLLILLSSFFVVSTSVSTVVACQKDEKFYYNGSFYDSREDVFNQVWKDTEIYDDNESSFSTYKDVLYSDLEIDKMYNEIIKEFPITKKFTLKNLDSAQTLEDNEIISHLPIGDDARIVTVYKDALGRAVQDKKQAIESYLSGTTWFVSEDSINNKNYFKHEYEIKNYLYNEKIQKLKVDTKTQCYDGGLGKCLVKERIMQKIRNNTFRQFNFDGFEWDDGIASNMEGLPDYKIQKYIDSMIRQSQNSKNAFLLEINQDYDNFYGDTLIWKDASLETMKDKLKEWRVIDQQSISPVFWNTLALSKFFKTIIDVFSSKKPESWNIKNDLFQNNESKYEEFREVFDSVSDLPLESPEFDANFSIKKNEEMLSKIKGVKNELKSLIFLKKILEEVAVTRNYDKEEELEKFNNLINEIIGNIFTKNMNYDSAKAFKEISVNNKFFSFDFINLILQPGVLRKKEDESEIDFVNNLQKSVDSFAETVGGVGSVAKIPELSFLSDVWKLTSVLSPVENKLLQLDFGDNQILYYKATGFKIPIINISLGNQVASNFINPIKVIDSNEIRGPQGGWLFLNTIYDTKQRAIEALKIYMVKYPEKFKEIKVKLVNGQSDFPSRDIENKGKDYSDKQIESYINDTFDYKYKNNPMETFTDGFGRYFNTKKSALESLNNNLEKSNFETVYVPYNENLKKIPLGEKRDLLEANKYYIEKILCESKEVLSTDLIANPVYDESENNISVSSDFYQVFFKGKLRNFRTYEDAKYFIIRNSKIDSGIYNSEKNFVTYKGNIFKDISNLESYISKQIIKV